MTLVRKIDRGIGRIVWWLMVRTIRWWSARYLDQFDLFKFEMEFGFIYVNIGRSTPWPDSFDLVNKNGRPISEPQSR